MSKETEKERTEKSQEYEELFDKECAWASRQSSKALNSEQTPAAEWVPDIATETLAGSSFAEKARLQDGRFEIRIYQDRVTHEGDIGIDLYLDGKLLFSVYRESMVWCLVALFEKLGAWMDAEVKDAKRHKMRF